MIAVGWGGVGVGGTEASETLVFSTWVKLLIAGEKYSEFVAKASELKRHI
jgi:hypothetical protein